MTKINSNILIKALFLIAAVLLICSCENNSNNQSEGIKSEDSSIKLNKLELDTNSIVSKDTNSIINIDSNPYLEMRKNKYSLPPISSVNFINVNSLFDKWYATDEFKDSLFKVLKFYHKRSPDRDKYQYYYFTIHCYTDSIYKCLCSNNDDMTFGLLILYEPISQVANVFCIHYNVGGTEHHQMWHSFDNNNTIHLTETGMTDGGEDEQGNQIVEDFIVAEHKIIINENGEIIVKTDNKNQE
jgi:hypothetical protein